MFICLVCLRIILCQQTLTHKRKEGMKENEENKSLQARNRQVVQIIDCSYDGKIRKSGTEQDRQRNGKDRQRYDSQYACMSVLLLLSVGDRQAWSVVECCLLSVPATC